MQKQALIKYWKNNKIITDERVINAFAKVPREDFLPKYLKERAYEDVALPIAGGQTISQPSTVMIMTQALAVESGHTVLEIGTGSGYQAAILSELVKPKGHVYTTEINKEAYEFGKKNLKQYKNIAVIFSDGSMGAEAYAPFDRIILTAASPSIPEPLIKQLKDKGIIIAPLGTPYEQKMVIATKRGKHLTTKSIGEFVFVPLTGKYGFKH
ncbi:MAG: protein-L-isoaspartate(D-aspartate) O-methyltransferase [Nanoarchaeota archaeon]